MLYENCSGVVFCCIFINIYIVVKENMFYNFLIGLNLIDFFYGFF